MAAGGNLGGEARSTARWALDAECPFERLDTVGETSEACPPRGIGAAEAVIFDLDPDPAVGSRHRYRSPGRAGVLRDVREGFRAEEVRDRLHLSGKLGVRGNDIDP